MVAKSTIPFMIQIKTGTLNLQALFDNTTEAHRVLLLLDELPGYVDIILQTALEPEKV